MESKSKCGACGIVVPTDAKFCQECGNKLSGSNLREAYELGRIAVLSDVKKEILTWFGLSGALITAAIGLLAAFGIDQMISSSVQIQTDQELSALETRVREAQEKAAIAANKSVDAVDQIKISELEIKRTFSEIRKLIKEDNLSPVINKMVIDFYNIKDFWVRATAQFGGEYRKIHHKFFGQWPTVIGQVNFIKSITNNGIKYHAQLSRDGSPTVINRNSISYKFKLFPVFEDDIYEKNISTLKGIRYIELQTNLSGIENEKEVSLIRNGFKELEIIKYQIYVNGSRIWEIDDKNPKIVLTEDKKSGRLKISIMKDISSLFENPLYLYESKFERKEKMSSR